MTFIKHSSCLPKELSLKAAVAMSLLFFSQFVIAGSTPTALPTGGNVQAGAAAISQNQNTMNINQSSQRAVIGWTTFNVGKNATVNFNQPNANSATLNIVNGSSQSMINGTVNANGQVVFVNNNGIVFGKNAEVNVGGMVATTMNIDPSAFMSGENTQTYSGHSGKVINKGQITGTNLNSYIALMAPEVRNEGVISATLSGNNSIALISGQQVTLTFNQHQLININVDASSIKSLIQNKRLIQVNGGQVIIAANSAQNLLSSVVQNSGTISASSISKVGGVIRLTAATVNQNGIVAANSDTSNGGQITIAGSEIHLGVASKTTVTGATGGGQILIGKTSPNTTNSIVNANQVTVAAGALVDASAIQNGNGGTIDIWSQKNTVIEGSIKANGGQLSGNGGMIDTSSAKTVTYGKQLVVETIALKGKIDLDHIRRNQRVVNLPGKPEKKIPDA